jgi:tetratricopeptide (TPR) repeat protein
MLSALTLLFSITACDFITAGERTAPASSNTASTLLIETASRQYAEGKLDQAAATLERALQIQPNNPATLHYLGVLRLQQGQYEQAEVLAARSNRGLAQSQSAIDRGGEPSPDFGYSAGCCKGVGRSSNTRRDQPGARAISLPGCCPATPGRCRSAASGHG